MTDARPAILIVDDEALSLQVLTRTLDDEFEVHTAGSAAEAEQLLEEERIHAVISDQRMPELTGVEFLSRVRERWPSVVRMIISGYTDPDDIIDGVNRAGIYQFIPKPWHPDNLLLIVRNACQLYRLQLENQLMALEMRVTAPTLRTRIDQQREQLKRSFRLDAIVRADDSPVNAVCEQVAQIAPYDISVVISGASGTGKELFARAIHYNSARADKPFVAENCGAMPDQLLESELFGHRRGAFTGAVNDRIGLFEQADGGTIFLDEIGDVSPIFQVKLLRVLQEGEIRPIGSNKRRYVDVRVVAATNKDLEKEIRAGRFREDLYYRLAGVRLHLPALRERRSDIPVISRCLLEEAVRAFGKPCTGFTTEALACMQEYHWPGNVRELRNEIQRMLVVTEKPLLEAPLLSPRVLRAAPHAEERVTDVLAGLDGSLKDRVEALELRLLRETMIRHRWNKSRAAAELGLSRVGLRNKLERYGLDKRKDA
jgi:two-component system response regulator HupR/HoxA